MSMFLKMRTLAAAACGAALLFGCSTPSINAIYSEDQGEVITDDRIVGVWHEDDPKKAQTHYHIGKLADDKANAYPIRITGDDEAEKHGRFELRLVRLGAHTYADIVPDKAERDHLGGRFGLAALAMHVIMPVTLSDDRVDVRPLDPNKVKAFIQQAPSMTPHAVRDNLVILTGDTRQIQQFYRKIADGDAVFADTVSLSRVEPPAAAPEQPAKDGVPTQPENPGRPPRAKPR